MRAKVVRRRTTRLSGQTLAPFAALGRCGLPLSSGVRARFTFSERVGQKEDSPKRFLNN